jgi:ankyrin repeat protein
MVAEALGLSGLLMGGALVAGPGGASLAARPAGTAPAPRSLPSPPAPTAPPQRTQPLSALDRNLITAAAMGDLELVRRLLAAGASTRAVDERGRNALLAAVYQRHGDVAVALVHAGADVNHKDRDTNSAFLLAAATGQLSVVRVAIERGGADLRSTDRYRGTALTAACQHGDREMVKLLLKAGVPVDHVNALGWTPLLEAIVLGDGSARYEEVVQLLIDAGADANLADHDGVTPTRHARERGYKTMVKTLMRARGH